MVAECDTIAGWQEIDLSTMTFPAEMLVDYVRVYQRESSINVGCNPKGYPTSEYIESHLDAYMSESFILYAEFLTDANSDANVTTWKWDIPSNSLWDGC